MYSICVFILGLNKLKSNQINLDTIVHLTTYAVNKNSENLISHALSIRLKKLTSDSFDSE